MLSGNRGLSVALGRCPSAGGTGRRWEARPGALPAGPVVTVLSKGIGDSAGNLSSSLANAETQPLKNGNFAALSLML